MSTINDAFPHKYDGKIKIKWGVPGIPEKIVDKFGDFEDINFIVPRRITILKVDGNWPSKIRIDWGTQVTVSITHPRNCTFKECKNCVDKKCKKCTMIGCGNEFITVFPQGNNTTKIIMKIGVRTNPFHPPVTDPKATVTIGEPP